MYFYDIIFFRYFVPLKKVIPPVIRYTTWLIMNNKRILITRLSALGDVIHTIPLVCALKRQFPNVFIGWVVEDKACAVLVNNPVVDKLYILPKKKWKKNRANFFGNMREFFSIIAEIKRDNYDIAIDVQGLLKSACVNFLSGAKRRLSHKHTREFAFLFANELIDSGTEFSCSEHIIERNLRFAAYLGCNDLSVHYSLPSSKEEDKMYVSSLMKSLDKNKKTIVFSPATTWENKHWLPEYWGTLLDEFSKRCNVIFTGMKADEELISQIISFSKNKECLSLAGKTDIISLLEVFRRADIVVSVDSGSAHLACSVEKPKVLCIIGPTSEKRNGPFGKGNFSFVADISCRPCFKKKCAGNNIECMRRIQPASVIEHINKLLTNT